jgi:hypothetical protein
VALVEIAIFHDPLGGDIARARLAAADIPSVLFDAGVASLGFGAMTPARLMVDDEDVDAARRILAE